MKRGVRGGCWLGKGLQSQHRWLDERRVWSRDWVCLKPWAGTQLPELIARVSVLRINPAGSGSVHTFGSFARTPAPPCQRAKNAAHREARTKSRAWRGDAVTRRLVLTQQRLLGPDRENDAGEIESASDTFLNKTQFLCEMPCNRSLPILKPVAGVTETRMRRCRPPGSQFPRPSSPVPSAKGLLGWGVGVLPSVARLCFRQIA